MKVDKELIEKYHRNQCTPEENAAVEAWLFDDEGDEGLDLPKDAEEHKQQMWANIAPALSPAKKSLIPLWFNVAAACMVIAAGIFLFKKAGNSPAVAALVEVDNSTALEVRHVKNKEYQLSVGPGTSASIDNKQGTIRFNGSMIIRPQRDIEFSFGSYPQKETFKSGETYILLDEQRDDGRVTIVNEKNLVDMPPGLQKRIITEFNI